MDKLVVPQLLHKSWQTKITFSKTGRRAWEGARWPFMYCGAGNAVRVEGADQGIMVWQTPTIQLTSPVPFNANV